MDDWLQTRNEQKEQGQILVFGDKEYSVKDILKKNTSDVNKELMNNYMSAREEARKKAEKIGVENGDKRISHIDALPEGPEKAKEMEKFLEESDNYHRRNREIFTKNRKDGFSLPDAQRIRDIKDQTDPKFYEITEIDSWLFNQILSKSGDWYETKGVSKGFTKITDKIKRLRSEEDQIYDKVVMKSRRHSDDPAQQEKVNKALSRLSKAKYIASRSQVKADKLASKVEKAVAKEEAGKKKLEEDRKRWDQDKETVKQESENKESAKKVYDEFELSDMARTEFNGNKEHDDALRDVPNDVIKDRIRLTRDWFNDEQYVTKEERETSLKYATEHVDEYRDKALKNLGDDLLSYVKEKSDEIHDKLWSSPGKMDSKVYQRMKESHEYDTYDQLQNWLTDRVYEKSGSMNADDYKPGSNAAKVYDSESFKKVRDDINNRYDEISKKTGYTFGNNYKKLVEACKKDSVWQKLDKEYQKHTNDLLGAILKDIGFRDTPENRYIIYQFAFID